MGLDVPHRRPLARLAARSAIEGVEVHDWHVGPYAPPVTVIGKGLGHVSAEISEICIRLLRGLLLGESLLPIRSRLATDVITWSPQIFAVSRDQLFTSVHRAGLVGETLSEVSLDVTDISAAVPRVYVEWRMTARFTFPGFIDDNLLIEPTGRLLETAGFQVVVFDGDVVVSAHCYYDDLALFEQLITSR